MNNCTAYSGHPELSCLKHGSPGGGAPCASCQLELLRELMPKAQAIILELTDDDVANANLHDGDCPEDDTCECQAAAAMNAVMGWKR